ncbi:protein of unknown function [Candidatus Methylacidiphilum fumarolicum]|uniref:Uncharacterized protein n=1 Tax=Candidatus Methylacidiphilum fumarolicum TaxID=591154 RepID=A0ABN8XED8_9BACT|nr:protein of unknown function [Candidatus Methylacidiphilum fumarolicum]
MSNILNIFLDMRGHVGKVFIVRATSFSMDTGRKSQLSLHMNFS